MRTIKMVTKSTKVGQDIMCDFKMASKDTKVGKGCQKALAELV